MQDPGALQEAHTQASEDALARRMIVACLIVLAFVALAVVLYGLLNVLLLTFAAALVAVILHAIADPLHRHTGLPSGFALLVAGLMLFGLIGVAFWLFQAQVGAQLVAATKAASGAITALGDRFGIENLSGQVSDALREVGSGQAMLGKVTSYGVVALGGITDFVLVLFGGVYFALDPHLYRRGVVKLFPARARDHVEDTMLVAGNALRLWLLGQFLSMLVTGLLTWGALALIGLPSAAALGMIAGLLEFIPLLGPFLGAIPALLVAFSVDPTAVLWTVAAFVAIQQIESNLIQPLITRQAVDVPPALLLFSVIAFGTLFGILGILLAAPLTVVVFVAVKKLYVREALGEPTPVPGEGEGAEAKPA